MTLPIGAILDGKFKIVKVLGEGGMGTVYKVEQATTPGSPPYTYALKELLISPGTSREEREAAIDRFNKEIALLHGLKHPHIAGLLFPFQENGKSYFVMEFVPGRSLENMLEDSKQPLPEDQVIKWGIQVCEALSYIHSRVPPIILRDLKPGNVMITPDDEVQLIDFGIARRFDPSKRTNTENLGTISYASPEHLGSITAPGQKRSAQNPGTLVQTDARSDIYSLGATLYHLLTNYEPDPIQTPTAGSIRAKNPRLRTVQLANKVVCPIEQVIIKAMQQAPAQRFQNADAMRVALQQCLPNSTPPTTISMPAVASPNATFTMPTTNTTGSPCPKCGLYNRPGAKFCKRDGEPLVQGVTAAPARPQPILAQPNRSGPNGMAHASNGSDGAYRLGLQHLANRNYREAINQFQVAQRLGGTSYEIVCNLGRAYRQHAQSFKNSDKKLFNENLKLAAEYFQEAIRYKANAFDIYFQLGMSYRDMELYPQAITAFKKAQTLTPQDPAIYYQLGLVAMEQGYYREAEAYLLDGLRISPTHTFILIALGRLYSAMKRPQEAITTLREATSHDAALWEGWYELGLVHMQLKEWPAALSALEQARQRDPNQSKIYCAMATCYFRMKKKSEARQMVTETLQRDPTNAEAIRLQKQL